MSEEDPRNQYKLTFEQRSNYLYVYVEGDHDSYEISRAYWREVAEESGRTGMKRVLIDENLPEGGSTTEMFNFAS